MTREDFINILADKYSCLPDYPWEEDNESAVFRHKVSKKWFALLMNSNFPHPEQPKTPLL